MIISMAKPLIILVLYGLVNHSQANLNQSSTFISSPFQSKEISISHGFNKITINGIPSHASHLLFQVHSPMKPIVISTESTVKTSSSKYGSHVGLVTILPVIHPVFIDYYIKSSYNNNLTILVLYQTYTDIEPIPGGCNLEFNLENDANILSLDNAIAPKNMLDLHFALGNVWFGRQVMLDCSSTLLWRSTQYQLYGIPLITSGGSVIKTDSLNSLSSDSITRKAIMSHIKKVTTIENIKKYGNLLATYDPRSHQPPKFVLARRINTAHIVAVLIQNNQQSPSTYASYVPTVVYGCLGNFSTRCSYIQPQTLNDIIFSMIGFIGIIFTLFAHKWPKTQSGVVACGIVLIFGLGTAQNVSHGQFTLAGVLIVCVLILPCLLLVAIILCRCLPDETRLHLYPTAFLSAYLIGASLYFSPLGDLGTMKRPETFAIVLPVSMLILLIVILPFKKLCMSFSTSVVGAFVFLAGISCGTMPGSLFHYLLLDQYLRLALPGYLEAVHYSPLGLTDLIVFIFWGVLSLISTIILFLYIKRKASRRISEGSRLPVSVASSNNNDENRPLLFDWNSRFHSYGQEGPSYGSTDNLLPVTLFDPLNPSIGSSVPSTVSSKSKCESTANQPRRIQAPLTKL